MSPTPSNYDTRNDPPNGGIIWVIGMVFVCVVVGILATLLGLWILYDAGGFMVIALPFVYALGLSFLATLFWKIIGGGEWWKIDRGFIQMWVFGFVLALAIFYGGPIKIG